VSIQFEITRQADEYWGGRRNKNSLTTHSFVMRFYCLVFFYSSLPFARCTRPVSVSPICMLLSMTKETSHARIIMQQFLFLRVHSNLELISFYSTGKKWFLYFDFLANTNLFEFPLFLKYQIKIDNPNRNAGVGIYHPGFVNPVPLPFNCLSSFTFSRLLARRGQL
jgi:hypothetical protein